MIVPGAGFMIFPVAFSGPDCITFDNGLTGITWEPANAETSWDEGDEAWVSTSNFVSIKTTSAICDYAELWNCLYGHFEFYNPSTGTITFTVASETGAPVVTTSNPAAGARTHDTVLNNGIGSDLTVGWSGVVTFTVEKAGVMVNDVGLVECY